MRVGVRDLEMRYSLVFRGIGIVRAKANVAMTNLTYNIARLKIPQGVDNCVNNEVLQY